MVPPSKAAGTSNPSLRVVLRGNRKGCRSSHSSSTAVARIPIDTALRGESDAPVNARFASEAGEHRSMRAPMRGTRALGHLVSDGEQSAMAEPGLAALSGSFRPRRAPTARGRGGCERATEAARVVVPGTSGRPCEAEWSSARVDGRAARGHRREQLQTRSGWRLRRRRRRHPLRRGPCSLARVLSRSAAAAKHMSRRLYRGR